MTDDVRPVSLRVLAGGASVAVGLVLTTLAGCGDEGPYAHLAERAEVVRELPFLREVPFETFTEAEFRAQVSQDVDETTDAELREYADTYGRLGFFDVNLELRPILTQSRIAATAAFYSSADARITFIGDPEDATVIHEYVHALQDQHFDLVAYDAGAHTSDSFLARRAVVEGDAVLAQTRFLAEEDSVGLHQINYHAYFASWSEISERYLDESAYPILFNAYPSFVYTYGLFFSATTLFGASPLVLTPSRGPHDWRRLGGLYTSGAPATTAEILGHNDPVVPAGIGAIPPRLAGDLERIDSDTLGAWYTHLLFRPVGTGPLLADAWDGDQVLFARDTRTGAVGVLWTSVWDDERAASVAEEGLHALHDGAGESLLIERRGVTVVMARNFAAELGPEVIDAAFIGPAAAPLSRRLPLHARPPRVMRRM